ncbi:hypothetical protein C7999DRAFT_36478 [Corynascus novoguineensis]|uniref:Uncharacterized protein n=1 Tax=Corynascus novoguineensis TaxID=1126955 RepID=A0AAN7CLY0_9PEZI|nr:hypothetical protein C7999DRAFT_36478 [Corynascus novoguineensis]
MSKPAQVTDIYQFGGMHAANIDFQRPEYRVSWHGDWRNFPELGSFPQVPGATVTSILHSPEVDELWAKSQVLCYGADSHIRLLDQGPASGEEQFPVCKVAANDSQRRFMQTNSKSSATLARKLHLSFRCIQSHLLTGSFGFRMEKLLAIGPDTAISKSEFLKCLSRYTRRGSFIMTSIV